MRSRVESGQAKRRSGSVTAAVLIGLLLSYAALPLCSTAFTCTMPCCEDSEACDDPSRDCLVARVLPADIETILASPSESSHALPAFRAYFDIAPTAWTHAPLEQPRSGARRLYIVNDVFLI